MKKNFVSYGKGCIFAVPFEMEKVGERRGEIIESKQKPKAACHGPFAAGRRVVAGNEKGKKRRFRNSNNEEFDPGSG